MLKIIGYSDRLSVAPGETIKFMVSTDDVAEYQAAIVRMIHGDANPDGPGFKTKPVAADVTGTYPGRRQETEVGSYVAIPNSDALRELSSFTVAAFIWPTTPDKGRQGIISAGDTSMGPGFALEVDDDGGLALRLTDADGRLAVVCSGKPLMSRHWYLAAAAYDEDSRQLQVWQIPVQRFPHTDDAADVTVSADLGALGLGDAALTIGAVRQQAGAVSLYNGKIEAPRLARGVLRAAEFDTFLSANPPGTTIAAWEFARDITSTRVVDMGPHGLHGTCRNLPARAMKGRWWTGEFRDWRERPEHYGAIHFHDDDLYDAGWEVDFAWQVPAGTCSGLYCAHVRSLDGEHEDYIPFAVRPPRGRATADFAVLLPTVSYMAYANDHSSVDADEAEMMMGRLITLQPADLFIDEHRELGLGLYDTHSDGSGVCYSSRLRPIVNMRPKYSAWVGSGLWQFNADTHLFDWLEEKGFTYDVITDEDLHFEGADLLKPYRAVVSGTHPEYQSTAMWDGMRGYLDTGGRLMYMGGDGWYWRVAFHESAAGVIEVRRAEDGIRTWLAEPGEYHHSFTGEYGGLWRRLGRPPNVLVGTGFSAQGFDASSYYTRQHDSTDPRAAFIFEGIGADDRIGDFGLIGGGAAGLELDRADPLLGTPPNTLVLASSGNHTDLYLVVCEEVAVTTPNLTGSQSPLVRADMTFHERAGGGAVFATSSIAWCGSLSHNGYDNNVSRITENVLRRFLDAEPFV